jgi:hypothetical protein
MGAVVLIWGIIVFRILNGLGGSEAPDIGGRPAQRAEVSSPIDTFTLYADYPDPFIPGKEIDDTVLSVANATGKKDLPVAQTVTAPLITEGTVAGMIQLKGIFGNPQKRSKVAIVTINGKEAIVHEKERVGGIYITKIAKDHLQIKYKGRSFTIDKEL